MCFNISCLYITPLFILSDQYNKNLDTAEEGILSIRKTEAWQKCFEKMSTKMEINGAGMSLWLMLERIKDQKDQEPIKSKLQESSEMFVFIEKCENLNIATAVADHYAKISDGLDMSLEDFFYNMEKAYNNVLADDNPYKEIRNLRLEIETNRLQIEELTKSLEESEQMFLNEEEENRLLNEKLAETQIQNMETEDQLKVTKLATVFLKDDIKDNSLELRKIREQLSDAKKRVHELEIDLTSTEKEKIWLDKQIEQLTSKNEDQSIQIEELKSDLNEIREIADTNKRNEDHANQQNEYLNSKLEDSEIRIIQAESQAESLETDLDVAKNQIKDLEEQNVNDNKVNNIKIDGLYHQTNKLKKLLSKSFKSNKDNEILIAELNAQKEDLNKEIKNKQKEITDLENQIMDLENQIDEQSKPQSLLSMEKIIADMPLLEGITTLNMNEELVVENGNQPLLIALKGDRISLKNKSAVTIDYAYDGVTIDLYGDLSFVVINDVSPECKNNPVQITIHSTKKIMTQVILGQNVNEEYINIQ